MTATTLVISDVYQRMNPDFGGRNVEWITVVGSGVPSPDRLDAFDSIVVLDKLESADVGIEMGGVLAAALSRGKLVALAFNVRIEASQDQMLRRLGVQVVHAIER